MLYLTDLEPLSRNKAKYYTTIVSTVYSTLYYSPIVALKHRKVLQKYHGQSIAKSEKAKAR